MTLKPFYDRTEDVHVGAYVAYGHTDGKLYADAEHKMKVSAAEATGVKTYDGTAAKSWTASKE